MAAGTGEITWRRLAAAAAVLWLGFLGMWLYPRWVEQRRIEAEAERHALLAEAEAERRVLLDCRDYLRWLDRAQCEGPDQSLSIAEGSASETCRRLIREAAEEPRSHIQRPYR